MTCSTPYNLSAFFNLALNLAFCHQCSNLVMGRLQTGLLIPCLFLTALTMASVPGPSAGSPTPGTELCFPQVVGSGLPYERKSKLFPTCPSLPQLFLTFPAL